MRTANKPNNTNYGFPGQMKEVTIKMRVPGAWIDVIDKILKEDRFLYKFKTRSALIRKMTMEALLSQCQADQQFFKMIQDQLIAL